MAVYIPATSWERAHDTCYILRSEERENFTCYVIEIQVPPFKWQVFRRYKQFVELHEKMTKQFALNKSLLPPKKLVGNRSESFIIQRQKSLEIYLQTLVYMFNLLPEPLASFLDFQKYEIRNITAALSEMLFTEGDTIIGNAKPFQFTALQLHAIAERLKLGDPTCYSSNPKQDLAHLIEFVTQLQHLKILGSSQSFETSNIIQNVLSYELSMFKFIKKLEIFDCKLKNTMNSVGHLRSTLEFITIQKTLDDLSEFLLCDTLHWSPLMDTKFWPTWNNITEANFSHNRLTKIHASVKLLPNVQRINFSHNEIEVIENLESLSNLSVLILSHNKIKSLDSLHTHLGNVNSLNLASNEINSLHGFSKMFSVSELILENNNISVISELMHLSQLPCLAILNLQNNPVTFTVDYRPQLLLMLNSVAVEITLDGQKTTEKEIDTVSVLQALSLARQKTIMRTKPNVVQQNTRTASDKPVDNISFESTSCLQIPEYATLPQAENSNESSKFRQQVETLRKTGGTDWLRLLNEMQCPSPEDASERVVMDPDQKECVISHSYFQSTCTFDENSEKITLEALQSMTYSFEISYPECLTTFDSSSHDFKQYLVNLYVLECTDFENTTNIDLADVKVLWAIFLTSKESSVIEIPVCILMLKTGLFFLQLSKTKNKIRNQNNCHLSKNYPEFIYLRYILASKIFDFCLGPCNAYIEFKVINICSNDSELLTILIKQDNATTCITEFENLYNIQLSQKLNPFANNLLNVENIDIDTSNCSISKQIIYGQRICVSKVVHKCHHSIIHYIFITSSHVILVEEIFLNHQTKELDFTVKHQFKVCALISVHTNIKQIYLKDVGNEIDFREMDTESSTEMQLKSEFTSKNDLNILYTYGYWLILEFESNKVLCLNFCSLKQRNEFLNAFLSARKQR